MIIFIYCLTNHSQFDYTTITKVTIQLQRYNIKGLTNCCRWLTFVNGVKVFIQAMRAWGVAHYNN